MEQRNLGTASTSGASGTTQLPATNDSLTCLDDAAGIAGCTQDHATADGRRYDVTLAHHTSAEEQPMATAVAAKSNVSDLEQKIRGT